MPNKGNAPPKGHWGKQHCEKCRKWRDNHHFSQYKGGWFHPWCNVCKDVDKAGARKAYEHRRAKLTYQAMTPEQRRKFRNGTEKECLPVQFPDFL